MYKKAIVATDLSSEALDLVATTGNLKGFGVEKILLIAFWDALDLLGIDTFFKAIIYKDLENNLKGKKEVLERHGFEVSTRVMDGPSALQVSNIALEEDYNLVVAASDSKVFNPMANKLIHNARKPTYIYKPDAKKHRIAKKRGIEQKGIADHLLFATDFSKNSNLAFKHLIEMLPFINNKITIVHVQDEYKISAYAYENMKEVDESDDKTLEKMKETLLKNGCPEVETLLLTGAPSNEILSAIEEHSPQLVMMGCQGRGFVNEFFLGSVSHKVARRSPVSVLLIPAKR